jgi:hypothetical protein
MSHGSTRKTIALAHADPVIHFAGEELARYQRLISRTPVACDVRVADAPAADGITLGCFADVGLADEGEGDPALDDAIRIDVRDGKGIIAGSNPRSVLLGVYRFLYALGCRWLRPGAEGEFLPRVDLDTVSVSLRHEASLRHRAICIEGAVSLENVLDVVDWAPKVGFSGYFMQFPDGYAFFDRYYSHTGDPRGEAEPFSPAAARDFTIRIEEEIRRRGLAYHAVGHGWHCRAIGIDVSHWNPVHAPASPEIKAMLAEVDGVRDYRWDRPMITSLCFSQEKVRSRMVEVITKHACEHPEVDYLHVWLDDGMGNKCDCEACRKVKPSDLYVRMLHELDASLTEAGSDMRIVFIGYTDLLWPPAEGTEPLRPERFSFVYANNRSAFEGALDAAYAEAPELPPFAFRNFSAKRDAGLFAAGLRAWQAFFPGDGMLFEYYFGRDFDQVPEARLIHDDVGRLQGMGLGGILNCQAQRVFFPTGISTYVLGQNLWDTGIDVEEMINDYYAAAFGPDSALAKEFIKLTVEEMRKAVRIGGGMEVQPAAASHLDKLENLLIDFRATLGRNQGRENPCQARSWYYLRWYSRVVEQLLALYRVLVAGDRQAALDTWKAVKTWLYTHEHHMQSVFDVHGFCKTYDRLVIDGYCSTAPEDVL